MDISTVNIYYFLQKYFTKDEIFKISEFSEEKFMRNLKLENMGLINQFILKQHFCLLEKVPSNELVKLLDYKS
jgi:hypothetical protein